MIKMQGIISGVSSLVFKGEGTFGYMEFGGVDGKGNPMNGRLQLFDPTEKIWTELAGKESHMTMNALVKNIIGKKVTLIIE